ncbi:hypothetical protein [Porphyromonas gingivalis]|uniref:hypothetical protein n=1 Tax=Porphyromonas gingivalis TaxID=837 RepID=UPI003BAA1643
MKIFSDHVFRTEIHRIFQYTSVHVNHSEAKKGSLSERMRQIVSSGPCGTGFVVPFDGIETNKTLTDNNTL